MNILLDTCTFLWMALEPEHLSPAAKKILMSPSHTFSLSVISAWEIAIKVSKKRLRLKETPSVFVLMYRHAYRIADLPLHEGDIALLPTLPAIHRDPFDRMLVCQAKNHELTMLTPDPWLAKYDVKTIW
jgi:PIN domain nuclease of toxin-antitoxin system